MSKQKSYLEGKRILAVDDEGDFLSTIEDVLENADVDKAMDYHSASEKINRNRYDLALLDIMGVEGLKLLEEAVDKNIPAIMLTAHSMNYDALMSSIRRGSIAFLPKDKLGELDRLLGNILKAHSEGRSTWKILFDELGSYFCDKFGDKMSKVEWICRQKGQV
jgi:DNA-binding NtrC family response regulator